MNRMIILWIEDGGPLRKVFARGPFQRSTNFALNFAPLGVLCDTVKLDCRALFPELEAVRRNSGSVVFDHDRVLRSRTSS